jgi:RNA polymerase sigma factor (sigma-70 family)
MMDGPATNPTIFLRLCQADDKPRELAWAEFQRRYVPVITQFACRLGMRGGEVDDVVQDVMIGFYSKSPTFVYDPVKGRFRGYLKTCTYNAVNRRRHAVIRAGKLSGDAAQLDDVAIDPLWEDLWEAELLKHAIKEIRDEMGSTKAFQAFEQYVMFEKSAETVAEDLSMHLNSVYRAKEQIVRALQQRLSDRRREEG